MAVVRQADKGDKLKLMADDEIADKTAPDDLDPAFDSIDATMKNVPPREVSVTPEALALIVNEAVAKAIAAYRQSLTESSAAPGGVAPRDPSKPAAMPQTPWRAKLEQLQGDMGISDIEFDGPRAAEVIIQRQLSAQMGVHDFEFDEIPAVAGEPATPTRTEADAVAGWKTPAHDAAPAAPTGVEQTRAPAATPDVEPMRAPAAPQQRADDAGQEFKWIEAALDAGRISTEADLLPAPPAVEPPPARTPEAAAPAIAQPPVTPKPERRETVTTPRVHETLSKPEVRETRRSLSRWFRSALADTQQAQVPEPAAVMPGREPKTPAVTVPPPAAASAPPLVTAPLPVAARPESKPAAAPDQNATAKPATPEEAAKTTFFTFDPILPVPPRLPRERNEPLKKG